MTGAGGLRALLRGEAMVIAPGAYDGLTAKLVAQAGFPAVYMTGAGTSVSHGYPDFGLLTDERDGGERRPHRARRSMCR